MTATVSSQESAPTRRAFEKRRRGRGAGQTWAEKAEQGQTTNTRITTQWKDARRDHEACDKGEKGLWTKKQSCTAVHSLSWSNASPPYRLLLLWCKVI